MIRLVATDLDGTLLGPDGLISRADADALLAASRAGVHVVVATGRPARWLSCLDPIADAEPHVIVSNGAAVWDVATRSVVTRQALAADALVDVARILRRVFPGVLLALEQGEVFGCEPGWVSSPVDSLRTAHQEDAVTVEAPFDDLLRRVGPVLKMLALVPDVGSEDAVQRAEVAVEGRAVVTHSVLPGRPTLLELSAPGVSKAATLASFCAARDVHPHEVAAFGDMPNDLAMLEFAGHPYAMGNAHLSLRSRFPVVGTNAEGGVGATVRSLLGSGPA